MLAAQKIPDAVMSVLSEAEKDDQLAVDISSEDGVERAAVEYREQSGDLESDQIVRKLIKKHDFEPRNRSWATFRVYKYFR